jgi:hypothetical protein
MPTIEKIAADRRIEPERANFRSLLVANPNYFGNLAGSKVKAVKQIAGNISYEELKCVGLYPEFDTLEAVVYVKKESGYGGGLCSNGTPEYVRFYLSYDNGATWQDQGVTSFNAQNIPGKKPLEYAVQLQIKPKKKFCSIENLPKVRAILSWNFLPPANSPNWVPVWGNVKNGTVQIDPFKFIFTGPVTDVLQNTALISLLKENNLIPADLTAAETQKLDLETFKKEISEGIQKQTDKELSAIELHKLYQDHKVGGERYLYSAVQKFSTKSLLGGFEGPEGPPDIPPPKNFLPELDIDLGKIIDIINNTDGNTGYEEMGCVGLNVVTDNLEATIKVKKPVGYLGNLCAKGSREYVAFWMDFGAGWEYVGTTSVRVHDIASIPDSGLDYAVYLPVNLAGRRQPCEKGPKVARVRAIMSWQTAPPPANPNWIPTWGNREETTVLITPGPAVEPGTHPPFIETVGGMWYEDINGAGLANGGAVTAGFSATDSPFGGEIVISGHLAYPTDISAGATPLEYRFRVSDDGGATWQTVSNSFGIKRTQLLDGIWTTLPNITQAAPTGWYTYREDLTAGPGNAQIFVAGNILARWQTNATMDGTWQIKIESRVQGTVVPMWTSQIVTVKVDNHAPDVSLDITSGGGACADFTSGTVVSGPYSALDDHFGSYKFEIVPAGGGTFTANPSGGGSFSSPSPLVRSYPAVSGTGEFGTWELDTTGIPQCGYVIYLHAWDRTIVDSGSVGHYNNDVVGLCIRT